MFADAPPAMSATLVRPRLPSWSRGYLPLGADVARMFADTGIWVALRPPWIDRRTAPFVGRGRSGRQGAQRPYLVNAICALSGG